MILLLSEESIYNFFFFLNLVRFLFLNLTCSRRNDLNPRAFGWGVIGVCMERNLGNYQLFFVYKLGTLGIWGSSPYSMEHLTPFDTFKHNPTYWGIALGRKENNITKPILDFQISYYLGNFRYDSNNSVVLLNLFPVRDLSIF